MLQKTQESINVFIAYSRKDIDYLNQLRTYLQPLYRNNTIKIWYDGEISPGMTWEAEIKRHLHDADIVLLLVSADSLASNYFYDKEMTEAMQRHNNGQTIVVPIILRDCTWELTDLHQLQALPKDGLPIEKWDSKSSAYANVVRGLYKSIDQVKERKAGLHSTATEQLSQAPSKIEKQDSQNERKTKRNWLFFGLPIIAIMLVFLIAQQFFPGTSPESSNTSQDSTNSAIDSSTTSQYVVWGSLPYWMSNAFDRYDYDRFTHISLFSYDIDPSTGGYTDQTVMKQLKLFAQQQQLKEKKQNLLLTISTTTPENLNYFLQNQGPQQQTMIDSVLELVEQLELNGVNLAFRSIPKNNSQKLLNFIRNFSSQLKSKRHKRIFALSLPHDFEEKGNYPNINRLNDYVDFFIINGHEFHIGEEQEYGPMSPLDASANLPSIRSTFKPLLKKSIPPSKFILELPYYGSLWLCASNEINNETCSFQKSLTYHQLINLYEESALLRSDSSSQSDLFIKEIKEDTYEIVWFEDAASLRVKYEWIKQKGLGGVAIWALGYDRGNPDLKAALEAAFK